MGKIHEFTYVAFDLEATYHPAVGHHEIIEFGAHRLEPKSLEIVASFEQLVCPSSPISWPIRRKTGITDEMVRGAPRIAQVWNRLATFVKNATLVGHQAALDISILSREAEHHSLAQLANPVLDTLRLARRLYPSEMSYALRHLQVRLGLEGTSTHRAAADAEVTAYLFKHLVETLEREHGISEYEQLWDLCYGRGALQQMKLF